MMVEVDKVGSTAHARTPARHPTLIRCPVVFTLTSMSTFNSDHKQVLKALDEILAKYFDEKDGPGKRPDEKFWATYLQVMKDEGEARPKDWDGNTGSILTFVRTKFEAALL